MDIQRISKYIFLTISVSTCLTMAGCGPGGGDTDDTGSQDRSDTSTKDTSNRRDTDEATDGGDTSPVDTGADAGDGGVDTSDGGTDGHADDTSPTDDTQSDSGAVDTSMTDTSAPRDTSTVDSAVPSDTRVADTATSPDGDASMDVSSTPPTCPSRAFNKPAPKTCSASNPPARCSQSRGSFSNWGLASVLTDLDITDKTCCFDVDGDSAGDIDNQLAAIINLLPLGSSSQSFDQQTQDTIIADQFVVLLEHPGYTPPSQATYPVNLYDATPADASAKTFVQRSGGGLTEKHGESFNLQKSSFTNKAYTSNKLPSVQGNSASLAGGEGRFELQSEMNAAFPLAFALRSARIRADVRTNHTNSTDGIALENGEIGGYIHLTDLLDTWNRRMSRCSCLGNPTQTLQYSSSPGDPDISGPLSCSQQVLNKAGNCSSQSGLCGQVTTVCAFASQLSSFSDLDADCDGSTDSLSAGFSFKAAAAKISGVSP